jgi:hypothetical protein
VTRGTKGRVFGGSFFCLTKSFPGAFKAFFRECFLSFFTEVLFKILDWESFDEKA